MYYNKILQWGDDGLYCSTCYTGKYHAICGKCSSTGWYYYASAEQIQGLIEEAEKRHDMKKEATFYMVVKDFSIDTLANNDDFNPVILKNLIRIVSCKIFDMYVGFTYCGSENILGDSPLKEELLRLGYIEEVVDDPVVKVGDRFKRNNEIYSVCIIGGDIGELQLIDIVTCNRWCEKTCKHKSDKEYKLSDLLSDRSQLSLFTPCKIEIREVEE